MVMQGVYGSVNSFMNGNVNDKDNLNNKMLRGVQFVDNNGVVQFITNFPGHYQGRANHLHSKHCPANELPHTRTNWSK
jgi:protocatechuate 3,4-dioxygenase beta subunit